MNATPSRTPTDTLPYGPHRHEDDEPPDGDAAGEVFDDTQAVGDAPVAAAGPCGRKAPAGAVSDERIERWIDAIVDHDQRALCALYDATLSRVYGLVLRIVRHASLAEEVVEDTYFQVWRQAARFDPQRGRGTTWLLGMAHSRAIDAVRRERRFQHHSLDTDAADTMLDDAPVGDDLLDVARHHQDLHRALLLLNAQPRQLVALAFFKGLSHEEIAAHTALPLGTVKSQIRRALITLRQVLGDTGRPALAS